ncbi:MAG: MltA domain-containing protein [cyanobacterium endosymbiont of Epithemia adnata isolate EadnSB Bon19]
MSHSTRPKLEGEDRLEKTSLLRRNKLVLMSYSFEVYLVLVQGSAKLKSINKTTISIGYYGSTYNPYISISK